MSYRIFIGLCACLSLIAAGYAAEPDTSSDEQALKEAKVSTDGPALVQYFKKMTLTEEDADKIKKLIDKLGDDEFEVRDKATAQLKERGPVALPFLRTAATKSSDPEIARRAEECIEGIK